MSTEAIPTATIAGSAAVALRDVTRRFGRGESTVVALHGISASFAPGTFTAIMGPSGSGKTTLLSCAAGLESPDGGSVWIGDAEVSRMRERRLARLRREQIGFVFQRGNLLPSLTATQNVILPLRLAGRRPQRRLASEALRRVGLGDRARHRPAQLSGGQQQRVAIARALVTRPAVIFADEPTGALDTRAAHQILALLRAVADDDGRTIVMVTHDPVAAATADRVVFLADGRIAGELAAPTPEAVAERLAGLGV